MQVSTGVVGENERIIAQEQPTGAKFTEVAVLVNEVWMEAVHMRHDTLGMTQAQQATSEHGKRLAQNIRRVPDPSR